VLPAPVKSSAPVPEAISINSATEEELARLEGVSEKLARAITKKRPFSSVDDLLRVKGVTLKLVAAIRSRLKL
jgi:competence ComEA-like helix-hairpin-helix protein